MSRLLSSRANKHKGIRCFCKRCMDSFNTKESLERHSEYCSQHGFARTVMPEEIKQEDGTKKVCPRFLRFRNYNRSMRVPFVIYGF